MDTVGDLRAAFQNADIHHAWESVYRRSRSQQAFNDHILARILRSLALPAGSLVLDAGCGTGEHTLRLAENGFECVGVDFARPALRQAEERARSKGLDSRVSFLCEGLEELPFADGRFDAVHCRGVLMHIPRWETVLAELCRVLRPGGKIVLLESNCRAVEAGLVRLARLVRKGESRLISTPGGLEFWVEKEGEAPLTRIADLDYAAGAMRRHGVRVVQRLATEFWDLNRFPAGLARKAAELFNRLWFALHLPATLSLGNAVIGQKG